jgi:hypothetical protein
MPKGGFCGIFIYCSALSDSKEFCSPRFGHAANPCTDLSQLLPFLLFDALLQSRLGGTDSPWHFFMSHTLFLSRHAAPFPVLTLSLLVLLFVVVFVGSFCLLLASAVSYRWLTTHKEHNKEHHALHGNTREQVSSSLLGVTEIFCANDSSSVLSQGSTFDTAVNLLYSYGCLIMLLRRKLLDKEHFIGHCSRLKKAFPKSWIDTIDDSWPSPPRQQATTNNPIASLEELLPGFGFLVNYAALVCTCKHIYWQFQRRPFRLNFLLHLKKPLSGGASDEHQVSLLWEIPKSVLFANRFGPFPRSCLAQHVSHCVDAFGLTRPFLSLISWEDSCNSTFGAAADRCCVNHASCYMQAISATIGFYAPLRAWGSPFPNFVACLPVLSAYLSHSVEGTLGMLTLRACSIPCRAHLPSIEVLTHLRVSVFASCFVLGAASQTCNSCNEHTAFP